MHIVVIPITFIFLKEQLKQLAKMCKIYFGWNIPKESLTSQTWFTKVRPMMHFYSPFSIICRLCHINEYVLIHFTILCFGQTALGSPQISLGTPSLGIFFVGYKARMGTTFPSFCSSSPLKIWLLILPVQLPCISL